jgi:hypothetical protein
VSQPSRSRFRLMPVPRYSTTTSNGTHVSCGGCCLPLPLGCLATVVGMAVPAVIAIARHRAGRRA